MAVVLGLSGAAWAQEGKGERGERERERKNKEASITLKEIDLNNDGKAQTSELQVAINRLSGNREGDRKKPQGAEGSIALKDVDSNADGKVTLTELTAALEKSKEGGEKREGGDRKKRD